MLSVDSARFTFSNYEDKKWVDWRFGVDVDVLMKGSNYVDLYNVTDMSKLKSDLSVCGVKTKPSFFYQMQDGSFIFDVRMFNFIFI